MDEDAAAAENPAKRLKISVFSLPVKVAVGRTMIDFYLPKFLLCSKSRYLQTLCEGRTSEIYLRHEQPKVFVLFASWLKRGTFESWAEYTKPVEGTEQYPASLRKGRMLQVEQLVKAYSMGDRLDSACFKNYVIDLLVDKLEELTRSRNQPLELSPTIIALIDDCKKSKESTSPLRQLFLDVGLKYIDVSSVIDIPRYTHNLAEFHKDLFKYAVEQFRLTQAPNGAYTKYLSAEVVKEHYHERLD